MLAIAPLILLGEILLFSRGAQFRGDWFWTIDWSAGSLILTGPLIAAIACWHSYFLLRLMRPAARLTARPTRVVSSILLGEASVAVVSQLVVLITAVAITNSVNHSPPPTELFAHLLLQLGWALGYSAIGCLAGLALPYVLTAPILAVALYFGFLPQSHLLPRSIADFGGSTGSLIGVQPQLSHDLIQALFLTTVVAVTLTAGTLLAHRRRNAVVSVLAVVSATSFFAAILVGRGTRSERLTYDRESYVCKGATVSVCLPLSGDFLRLKITAVLTDLRAAEVAWNAASPVRGAFLTQGGEIPGDLKTSLRPLVLSGNTLTGGRNEVYRDLLPMLVIDVRCFDRAQNTGEDLRSAVPDVGIITALIAARLRVPTDGVWATALEQFGRWSNLQQQEWRTAVLNAANSCRISGFPPPPRS